jgi:formylglycine-generating enzyme required for sulfatase activity
MAQCLVLRIGHEKMAFVRIEAGKFLMGSAEGLPLEMHPRQVHIRHPFYLSALPTTQRIWQTVMGSNPSTFIGDLRLPVDTFSWQEANRFCRRLSRITKCRIRLPTEAQWEYACRARTTSEYFLVMSVEQKSMPGMIGTAKIGRIR